METKDKESAYNVVFSYSPMLLDLQITRRPKRIEATTKKEHFPISRRAKGQSRWRASRRPFHQKNWTPRSASVLNVTTFLPAQLKARKKKERERMQLVSLRGGKSGSCRQPYFWLPSCHLGGLMRFLWPFTRKDAGMWCWKAHGYPCAGKPETLAVRYPARYTPAGVLPSAAGVCMCVWQPCMC